MAEVKGLLADNRLLTLTGPGGCGKTRLALQVANGLVERFEDGVWLVELASLTDPTLLPQTVASVLRVREQPGCLLTETLSNYLKPKKTLLIWDNCEHLVEVCAALADTLLRVCPNLHILATSQEVLGVAGEIPYLVPSLSLPATRHLSPIEELPHYEAVRLFIERAVSVLPTLRLTDQNASAVAQVCQRLDGVPLAIELAAARVKVLAVEQIAERLDVAKAADIYRKAIDRERYWRQPTRDLCSATSRTILRRARSTNSCSKAKMFRALKHQTWAPYFCGTI